MTALLTGANGQLGRELTPLLAERGDVICCDLLEVEHHAGSSCVLDIGDREALTRALNEFRPSLIVNAAAYTAVDKAEEEPQVAQQVNAVAPGVMAEWAARNNGQLLHFSTDYVFSGNTDRPYSEQDKPAPVNVYGVSKLEGERRVLNSGSAHLVMRTSGVYASHGHNFLRTMLRLAREGKNLSIVGDQVLSPTWAANLARYAINAIDKGLGVDAGPNPALVHAVDTGTVSWHDFALLVFEEAAKLGMLTQAPAVTEIGSANYPQPAPRPTFSALNNGLLTDLLDFDPVSLQDAVTCCLQELQQRES